MKDLKKLFFIVSIFVIFNIPAFARSGFEFILNVPIGASYSIISQNMKDYEMKNYFGFDVGVNTQLGYMHQIKEGFGMSYLLELGYNVGSYSIMGKPDFNGLISSELSKIFGTDMNLGIPNDISVALNFYFDSIQIGLFPKFNFGNFSIGIGGEIKIPVAGQLTVVLLGREDTQTLNRGDMVDFFNPPIFGYVKTSFDYSFYLAEKIALDVGLYLGYDIMKFKEETGKDEYGGTLNAGIVFGVKFGGKVD